MPRDGVIDRDLGEKSILRRLIQAEGMEVRVGYLKGSPVRYPRTKGQKVKGSEVAKVAAVHGLIKMVADVWDAKQGDLNRAIERAHARVIGGMAAKDALVEVGNLLRDAMRDKVYEKVEERTGRLREALRATVFDGNKRVAGDDHTGPKASESV